MSVLARLNKYLPLKPSPVGDPDIYHGDQLAKIKLVKSVWAWEISLSRYLQAVKNCASHLSDKFDGKYRLPKRADNPFPTDYCPETNVTEPMTLELASFY